MFLMSDVYRDWIKARTELLVAFIDKDRLELEQLAKSKKKKDKDRMKAILKSHVNYIERLEVESEETYALVKERSSLRNIFKFWK